jgi:hypothetical protein
MNIHRIEQGTPEWKAVRLGIPTASWFHCLITPAGRPSENRERKKYLYRLVAERILKQPMPDSFVNSWMERGNDLEEPAAKELATMLGVELLPGGFITDDRGLVGCSPDRLIANSNEAVEIKVPTPWVHIGNMLDGPNGGLRDTHTPDKYRAQVQGQILIGSFHAVHFWSWNYGLPPVYVKTEPDWRFLTSLEVQISLFLEELDETEAKVRKMGPTAELAEPPLPGHFPW